MSYVMSLPWDMFVSLLSEALRQKREEYDRQEWLAHLPWMGEDNYVSWSEFREQREAARKKPTTRRSKEELLAEAAQIRAAAAKQQTA